MQYGTKYLVAWFRDDEIDDPENFGGKHTDRTRQLADEIQEACDTSGLPAGVFKIIGVETGLTYEDWDKVRGLTGPVNDGTQPHNTRSDKRRYVDATIPNTEHVAVSVDALHQLKAELETLYARIEPVVRPELASILESAALRLKPRHFAPITNLPQKG